jgi:acetyl esterase/lipase
LVVQVHGGGWERGSRYRSLAQSSTARLLVNHGIGVASVGYRLAPANPWPDQIVDVECAIRFLRAHAAALGVDPRRLALWGSSAGGQLVSLAATAGGTGRWDLGPYRSVPVAVAAVVDEFGPVDLTRTDFPPYTAGLIERVFGHPPGAALKVDSPVAYVGHGDPPFLILQGTADRIVPVSQSEELASRLRTYGDPVRLELVAGGGHGLGTPGESPGPARLNALILAFLRGELHAPVTVPPH